MGLPNATMRLRRRVNGGNSLNRRWLEGKREQNPYVSKEGGGWDGGGYHRPNTLPRLRPSRNLSHRVGTLKCVYIYFFYISRLLVFLDGYSRSHLNASREGVEKRLAKKTRQVGRARPRSKPDSAVKKKQGARKKTASNANLSSTSLSHQWLLPSFRSKRAFKCLFFFFL